MREPGIPGTKARGRISDLSRRPAIAAIVCAEYTWLISLQNKNHSKGGKNAYLSPRLRRGDKGLQAGLQNKNPVPAYKNAGTGSKSNPAVPPGLTRTRPTHPYHHTVALFTECRSVAHRARIPPSDCPPKSIHTIQSVPRSQRCAALCDTLGSATYSSSTVSYEIAWILLRYFAKVKIFFDGAPEKKKRAPENRSSLVTRTGFEPMLPP